MPQLTGRTIGNLRHRPARARRVGEPAVSARLITSHGSGVKRLAPQARSLGPAHEWRSSRDLRPTMSPFGASCNWTLCVYRAIPMIGLHPPEPDLWVG